MMNLNEFAKEVHANAIAHGWWGEEYTDAVVIALIHAEVSEAFEEWRANRPMVWHRCNAVSPQDILPCEACDECSDHIRGTISTCRYRDDKPEGIATELIDVALRVLDAAAAWHVKLDDLSSNSLQMIESRETLPKLVTRLHCMVCEAYQIDSHGSSFSTMLASVFCWLKARDLDPEVLMLEKHEYNKTRPYRHGGKRC